MLYSSSLQSVKQSLGPFAGAYSADEEASFDGLMEKTGGQRQHAAVSQLLKPMSFPAAPSAGAGVVDPDAPLTELEKVRRWRWGCRTWMAMD